MDIPKEAERYMKTYQLRIDGMGCTHCVGKVSRALTEAGFTVLACEIGSARISSELDLDGAEASARAALDEAGYDLVGITAA